MDARGQCQCQLCSCSSVSLYSLLFFDRLSHWPGIYQRAKVGCLVTLKICLSLSPQCKIYSGFYTVLSINSPPSLNISFFYWLLGLWSLLFLSVMAEWRFRSSAFRGLWNWCSLMSPTEPPTQWIFDTDMQNPQGQHASDRKEAFCFISLNMWSILIIEEDPWLTTHHITWEWGNASLVPPFQNNAGHAVVSHATNQGELL